MNTRRELLAFAALAATATTSAAAPVQATTIHRQPLPPPFDGWEAEFVTVSMEPGPGSAPHSHSGFVLGYVVEGEFRFAVEGAPERVLPAGQAFYEAPGARHTVSASASKTRGARILAIVISKKAHP